MPDSPLRRPLPGSQYRQWLLALALVAVSFSQTGHACEYKECDITKLPEDCGCSVWQETSSIDPDDDCCPVLVAGAVRYTAIDAASRAGQFVLQPTEWVPFSADVRHVKVSGAVSVGRFHRGSDGSTRSEAGPSLDDITVIAIENIRSRSFWVWNQHLGYWRSQPMDIPPDGWRPVPTRANIFTSVADKIEGFEVLRRGNSDGSFELVAPQLNLFPLVTTCPTARPPATADCALRYYNIKIGEQPAELLELPAGAQVVPLAEPGGLVRKK
jgi:hypothetical protein